VIDIRFQDSRADMVAAVASIYEQIGLELTEDTEARMRAFLVDHPGDGAGGLNRYSCADTGLDEAALRERARDYQEYFDVESEPIS
jgi:hypothetical protein